VTVRARRFRVRDAAGLARRARHRGRTVVCPRHANRAPRAAPAKERLALTVRFRTFKAPAASSRLVFVAAATSAARPHPSLLGARRPRSFDFHRLGLRRATALGPATPLLAPLRFSPPRTSSPYRARSIRAAHRAISIFTALRSVALPRPVHPRRHFDFHRPALRPRPSSVYPRRHFGFHRPALRPLPSSVYPRRSLRHFRGASPALLSAAWRLRAAIFTAMRSVARPSSGDPRRPALRHPPARFRPPHPPVPRPLLSPPCAPSTPKLVLPTLRTLRGFDVYLPSSVPWQRSGRRTLGWLALGVWLCGGSLG
jgi:hypothetical protein